MTYNADDIELAFKAGYACGMDHDPDKGFEKGSDEAWKDEFPVLLKIEAGRSENPPEAPRGDENALILTGELLNTIRLAIAVSHGREPEYSNLLREQIRLEDRLRELSDKPAGGVEDPANRS